MKRVGALLLCVAGLATVVLASGGEAWAQGQDDPAQVEAGQAVFETSCAGCHGADGAGVAGLGRPLLGIAEQGDRATHVGSIREGKGGMPAFGPQLSDEEIEQAASYVRLTFVEEAAADAEPEALAETGVSATGLAVVGFTMLIGGLQLVVFSNRKD